MLSAVMVMQLSPRKRPNSTSNHYFSKISDDVLQNVIVKIMTLVITNRYLFGKLFPILDLLAYHFPLTSTSIGDHTLQASILSLKNGKERLSP